MDTSLLTTAVRPARPADQSALDAFIERCSRDTLYRRFHALAPRPIRREVQRMAHPTATHRSWVAAAPDGAVHAVATLAWGRAGDVHVAFVVEDAWFRRGLGRALFGTMARAAERSGVGAVTATIQADNHRAVDFLRAVAPGVRPRFVGAGEVEATIPVAAVTGAMAPAHHGEAA